MGRIFITVTDEEGRPVEHAGVAFSARVITPRFVMDEAELLHLAGVDVRVTELAARTDKNGLAEISERPAPRVLGPLGPIYVLARAARGQSVTPYVDWMLTSGKNLLVRVERTGYKPLHFLANPAERVRVRLQRIEGPSVRGRVLDSGGRLVWGAEVEVLEEERGPLLARGQTDHEGRFDIPVRRPGSFTVSVFPPESDRLRGERAMTVRTVADLETDLRTLGPAAPTSGAAAAGVVADRTKE
ncbi:MAG: hypothetical protein HY720_15480 [Planctomycetes bacterium]|nr:hypothetical protein [Planctomycetota bacterium]